MNILQACSRYLEFFACGDAIGKATEFMSYEAIKELGPIKGLVPSAKSQNHSDLEAWRVTDDTEQNLFLLRRYLKDEKVTVENTVEALLDWVDQTSAIEKHYIGPSSLRALKAIKQGADYHGTGLEGSTCGAIMRSPASVFASMILNLDLDTCLYNALVPTHNNSIAMESAWAYGYALRAAINNEDYIKAAYEGARIGIGKAPWLSAGATLSGRLEYLESLNLGLWPEDKLKRFLYYVMGTGLCSYETSSAVFAYCLSTGSPMKAILLCSETGGDTDTIAALAGGLLSMVNLEETLDESIICPIKEHQNLSIK